MTILRHLHSQSSYFHQLEIKILEMRHSYNCCCSIYALVLWRTDKLVIRRVTRFCGFFQLYWHVSGQTDSPFQRVQYFTCIGCAGIKWITKNPFYRVYVCKSKFKWGKSSDLYFHVDIGKYVGLPACVNQMKFVPRKAECCNSNSRQCLRRRAPVKLNCNNFNSRHRRI